MEGASVDRKAPEALWRRPHADDGADPSGFSGRVRAPLSPLFFPPSHLHPFHAP